MDVGFLVAEQDGTVHALLYLSERISVRTTSLVLWALRRANHITSLLCS